VSAAIGAGAGDDGWPRPTGRLAAATVAAPLLTAIMLAHRAMATAHHWRPHHFSGGQQERPSGGPASHLR